MYLTLQDMSLPLKLLIVLLEILLQNDNLVVSFFFYDFKIPENISWKLCCNHTIRCKLITVLITTLVKKIGSCYFVPFFLFLLFFFSFLHFYFSLWFISFSSPFYFIFYQIYINTYQTKTFLWVHQQSSNHKYKIGNIKI